MDHLFLDQIINLFNLQTLGEKQILRNFILEKSKSFQQHLVIASNTNGINISNDDNESKLYRIPESFIGKIFESEEEIYYYFACLLPENIYFLIKIIGLIFYLSFVTIDNFIFIFIILYSFYFSDF